MNNKGGKSLAGDAAQQFAERSASARIFRDRRPVKSGPAFAVLGPFRLI